MNDEPGWRQSRLKRIQVALIARVVHTLIVLIGLTLRLRIEGREHMARAAAPAPPRILSLWHGRILPLLLFLRHRGIVVIVSENFDGEWIARVISRLGFATARGSSSRNARAAARQLVRDIRAGRWAAFTLDGPRGPAGVAKPGAVWLAGATGAPLLPIHAECERSWELRSWDRAQIPKPFSAIHIVVGEPITVPRGLDDEAQARTCRTLEAALEGLRRRACELAGKEA